MDEITLRLIHEQNPWRSGAAFETKQMRREIFAELAGNLKYRQILALYGLRQVGKSTLMKQLVGHLLAQGVKPKKIMYFNFEDRKGADNEIVDGIIREAEKEAWDGRVYVLLDEIQKIPYWQDVLKRHYDMEKGVKFVVSGSASMEIKKSKESLAGRILDFHVPVLGFREYLELSGMDVTNLSLGAPPHAGGMRLPQRGSPVKNGRIDVLSKIDWEAEYKARLPIAGKASGAVLPYLYAGAFPELAGRADDEGYVKNYIKNSVIDKIVYTDIPETFGVRNRELLMAIMEYASRETAQLFEMSSLANALGVNRDTISEYVNYLALSFLLGMQPNFTKSAIKQMRTLKKLHIAHPCIATAIRRHTVAEMGLDELCGKYAESAVFQALRERYEHVYFFRNAKGEEVDAIIRQNEKLLPVEVKFQGRIVPDDFIGLEAFFREKKKGYGLMVTKNRFGLKELEGGKVQLVPLWLFLLCI